MSLTRAHRERTAVLCTRNPMRIMCVFVWLSACLSGVSVRQRTRSMKRYTRGTVVLRIVCEFMLNEPHARARSARLGQRT